MMEAIEIIKQATLSGKVLTLPPGQLDRKLYSDVAKKLEGIGGKWDRKVNGFKFANNPFSLLEEMKGGNARNIKKELQAFYTPDDVADFMARELMLDTSKDVVICEPSAGDGALIRALRRDGQTNPIECYEINEHEHPTLRALPGVTLIGFDFMTASYKPTYDRIIANPPFTKGQDIAHISRMYELLKPKGRLVTCCSTSWQSNSANKYRAFKQWLEDIEASVYDLERGRFKSSGTMVATCILVIDK